MGVKQGCPLSPLLFSLYINEIGMIAEGVQGVVTRSEDVRVTHMLYADDLTLLAYAPDAMQTMQTMLNRLGVFALSKHLTIKTGRLGPKEHTQSSLDRRKNMHLVLNSSTRALITVAISTAPVCVCSQKECSFLTRVS